MYKIIDIHTHTYPEAISEKAVKSLAVFYDFTVDGKGTYADLEAQAKQTGVNGFLLFSVDERTSGHKGERHYRASCGAVAQKWL